MAFISLVLPDGSTEQIDRPQITLGQIKQSYGLPRAKVVGSQKVLLFDDDVLTAGVEYELLAAVTAPAAAAPEATPVKGEAAVAAQDVSAEAELVDDGPANDLALIAASAAVQPLGVGEAPPAPPAAQILQMKQGGQEEEEEEDSGSESSSLTSDSDDEAAAAGTGVKGPADDSEPEEEEDLSGEVDKDGVRVLALTGDLEQDRATLLALMESTGDTEAPDDKAVVNIAPDEATVEDAGSVTKKQVEAVDDPDTEGGLTATDITGVGRLIQKTKNEQAPAPVPPLSSPIFELSPDTPLTKAGVIAGVLDDTAIVVAPDDTQALELSSPLFFGDRTPMGLVDETFGPVTSPCYAVRYNSAADAPAQVVDGAQVFYAQGDVRFVLPERIRDKGSDASNVFDEEPGANEVEFSDDEAEAEYKRAMKLQRKRKAAESSVGAGVTGPGAAGASASSAPGKHKFPRPVSSSGPGAPSMRGRGRPPFAIGGGQRGRGSGGMGRGPPPGIHGNRHDGWQQGQSRGPGSMPPQHHPGHMPPPAYGHDRRGVYGTNPVHQQHQQQQPPMRAPYDSAYGQGAAPAPYYGQQAYGAMYHPQQQHHHQQQQQQQQAPPPSVRYGPGMSSGAGMGTGAYLFQQSGPGPAAAPAPKQCRNPYDPAQ